MPHTALSLELRSMANEDSRVRAMVARDGRLFDRYHPRMREVYDRRAERLSAILDAHGWPGRSLVGEVAACAAWFAQDLERKRQAAVPEGDRPPKDWLARQRDRAAWLRDTGWRV